MTKAADPRRPLLMGILNVTPDSFSNEGEHFAVAAALAHAERMIEQGADIIDIGGESTRPGAARVASTEQIARVVPVIGKIRQNIPAQIPVSIDTTRAEVAAAALEAGASMINDVSAGRDDPALLTLAADKAVPIILMHMQGEPATMQLRPEYEDVLEEVSAFLLQRARAAEAAGVRPEHIYIDPGIGFGKTLAHNLDLIAHVKALAAQPYKVLLGASRKRFMTELCQVAHYNELLGGSCAVTAFAVLSDVSIIRVHDVKENRQALDLAYAIKQRMRD